MLHMFCSVLLLWSCPFLMYGGGIIDPVARNALRRCGDPILLSVFGRDETSGYGADDITSFADTSEFSAEASCDYSEILGPMK